MNWLQSLREQLEAGVVPIELDSVEAFLAVDYSRCWLERSTKFLPGVPFCVIIGELIAHHDVRSRYWKLPTVCGPDNSCRGWLAVNTR